MKILIFLFSLLFINQYGYCQSNPMFSHAETAKQDSSIVNSHKTNNTIKVSKPSFFKRIFNKTLRKTNRLQVKLRSTIVEYANRIKQNKSGFSYLWVLVFSFLYGIIHSLGPGHNKVIVFSYFIGEKANIKQGLILGNVTAFIHALSGLIVAYSIIYILNDSTTASFDRTNTSLYIKNISFSLITIIGIILLISHIINFRKRNSELAAGTSTKRIIPMALALGIIPCPGTMILVSFLSIAGLTFLAPWAALFMALGMGVTISTIGIITVFSKKLILNIFDNKTKTIQKFQFILAIIGSLFIIFLGLSFLLI